MGVRVLFDPDAPYEHRLPPWSEVVAALLAASSPDELRELIIEDYAGQQVPRGTERHARA
jgi:hypothetical protein